MYKCSECGIEFETAPKYCECGNDIFINVEEQEEFIPQEIEDDVEIPVQTSKYHGGRRIGKKFSAVDLSIFWLCIILSLLVLFVIANPQKDSSKPQIKVETAEKIKIPSVDSYWDNTPVKTVQKEELQPQKQENIFDKIVQQIVPQEQSQKLTKPAAKVKTSAPISQKNTQTVSKTVQNTVPKTSSKTTSKPSSAQTGMTFEDLTNKIRNQYPAKNSAQTQKQTTQTSQTTTPAPLPQKSSNVNQVTAPQTSNQTAQKKQPVTKSQTQTTQTQPQPTAAPVVPQKSQAQLSRELEAYKSGLRNTIARKIDFTRVIGDGDCALSFKVNSNGRLTSKAFTKQSSNITLNDAVFNALNTTTSYNPPPEGYNGETLRMNIRFYNGNFEISLH